MSEKMLRIAESALRGFIEESLQSEEGLSREAETHPADEIKFESRLMRAGRQPAETPERASR